MKCLSVQNSESLFPPEEARRQFLQRLAALCAAAAVAPVGAAVAPRRNAAALKARTAAQWARINRGLDPKTMAACRKAAANLAPRAMTLLTQPGWEAQTIKAVVDELKKAGIYPARGPRPDAACAKEAEAEAEADRLRSEATSRNPTSNTIAAGLATADAAVTTIPVVGAIIAAVLMLIAAVIILIGQVIAKQQEDQAEEKKQPTDAKERETRKVANANLLKLQDALVLKLEPVRDCDCFGKKVS